MPWPNDRKPYSTATSIRGEATPAMASDAAASPHRVRAAKTPHGHAVGDRAEPDQSGGAGECCDRIERAEVAVAQLERSAELATEQSDEVGLSEARREGQQKACRQPTGVDLQKIEIDHASSRGGAAVP
jgi:hypothetical protein